MLGPDTLQRAPKVCFAKEDVLFDASVHSAREWRCGDNEGVALDASRDSEEDSSCYVTSCGRDRDTFTRRDRRECRNAANQR